ncbi:MAG TPA: beta-L-arabinofuranosidase domain-containing protein [Rectinemataceae bacterium]|nr:beta-L-arabinofuranosidase domain-containing protein [Rectinemataceae bacterium]
MKPLDVGAVKITDVFWNRYIELVREVIVPYQWEVMNDRVPGVAQSHAIANFRIAAGRESGEFYGRRFQDSDVAKWLEAVAYCLATKPDQRLEALADDLIETIGEAQWPDGYLNTYFTLAKKGERWTNERESHELYIAGHLIEAAVAYFRATGKGRFLEIMKRNADHIDAVFGPGPGQLHGYPGHQVIEMALAKLYEATGEERYLRLAKYFLDERGRKPHFFELEAVARGEPGDLGPFGLKMYEYNQSHLPVREQKKAVGHAVRAVYMYSGMADVAALSGDKGLAEACGALWEDVTRRQMFVTGGIGQLEWWEGFSRGYDLPNDTPYNETCASIGLMFWASRMSRLELKGDYFDVAERALYNGILSGLALDGKSYFYTNLLEAVPEEIEARLDAEYSGAIRRGWFPCACCPPNLARLIASLGGYIYSADERRLAAQLFIASSAKVAMGGVPVEVTMEGDYLRDGSMSIAVSPDRPVRFTLSVRMPGWCGGGRSPIVRLASEGDGSDAALTNGEAPTNGETPINNEAPMAIEDGYLHIDREWKRDDRVELNLPMSARRVRANPLVREDAGKVALTRGPQVYCLEEVDNGPLLSDITLAREPDFETRYEPDLLGGLTTIEGKAFRGGCGGCDGDDCGSGGGSGGRGGGWRDELYREADFERKPIKAKAIPYYAWANRGRNEMRVWINQD